MSLRKTDIPCFTYTDFDCYVSQSYNVIKTQRWNNKALTVILNSSTIAFWLRYKGKMQGDNYQIDKEPLLAIPLPKLDEEITEHFVKLAEQMIDTKKNLSNAKSDADKKTLEQKVALIDQQINSAVYKLYALSDSEIKVIEGK